MRRSMRSGQRQEEAAADFERQSSAAFELAKPHRRVCARASSTPAARSFIGPHVRSRAHSSKRPATPGRPQAFIVHLFFSDLRFASKGPARRPWIDQLHVFGCEPRRHCLGFGDIRDRRAGGELCNLLFS